jgi:hypothetical protein
MKTARLIAMVVGFTALTLGLSLAAEPASDEVDAKSSAHDRPSDPVTEIKTHGQVDPLEAKHPKLNDDRLPLNHFKPIAINHEDFVEKRATVDVLPHPGLTKAAAAANTGESTSKTEPHPEMPARLPVSGGITALAPGVVRDRSAPAAVLGGVMPASAKTATSGINGTDFKPKTY